MYFQDLLQVHHWFPNPVSFHAAWNLLLLLENAAGETAGCPAQRRGWGMTASPPAALQGSFSVKRFCAFTDGGDLSGLHAGKGVFQERSSPSQEQSRKLREISQS